MLDSRRIFLSYAREDEQRVAQLYQLLKEAGYRPWMDQEDILAGEKWKQAIEIAVEESDFFLACLSHYSVNKRGFIQRELEHALELVKSKLANDIYIIPIRLEECEPPRILRDFQYVDLFAKDGWKKLVLALEEGQRRLQSSVSSSSGSEMIKPLQTKLSMSMSSTVNDAYEIQRNLQVIPALVKNDPVRGIRRILELEQQSSSEPWLPSLRDELASIKAEFRKNDVIQQQVLTEAGQALFHNPQVFQQIVGDFIGFFFTATAVFQNPLRDAFLTLLRAADVETALDESFPERAHQAAIEIWKAFDDVASNLLRPLLIGVYERTANPSALLVQLSDNASRLMRDAEIQKTIKNRGVESDLFKRNHRWREIVWDAEIDEDELVDLWLNFAHLKQNPFSNRGVGADALLFKSWINPENWKPLTTNHPVVAVAPNVRDCTAIAMRLLNLIRTQNLNSDLHRTTFPIQIELPMLHLNADADDLAYLEQVARASSESWCELLANDVDTYYELEERDKLIVTELLHWSSEPGKLEFRLRYAGLPENASGRRLLYHLFQSVASATSLGEPSEAQLHSWFRVRPKNIERTFLIVFCSNANEIIEAHSFERRLSAIAERLSRDKIILKLFTSIESGSAVQNLRVKWEKTALVKGLTDRVQFVSDPGFEQKFSDFFDPAEKPVNVEAIMARYARGSLNRMLDLGNAILQARVKRGGITNEFDFYLKREDLLEALNEFKRVK